MHVERHMPEFVLQHAGQNLSDHMSRGFCFSAACVTLHARYKHEARNNILHSSTGYAADAEKEQHFGTLLHYKRNAHSMLHYGDRHHISYPVQEIASWDRKRKKKTVAQLDRLHRQYKQECQLQAEGQKKLTAYDFYIIENEMVGD